MDLFRLSKEPEESVQNHDREIFCAFFKQCLLAA